MEEEIQQEIQEEIQTIKQNLQKKYNEIKEENLNNYIGTNATSKQNIVDAINKNLVELSIVHNEISQKNNINQEILIKKEKLLQIKNNELMEQLRELEMIESNIANKDRIIQQTNYNIEKQNFYIHSLVISIILSIFLCIIIFLYSTGKIDLQKCILLSGILVFCFFILILYTFNILYFKDTITTLFNRKTIQSFDYSVMKWADKIKSDIDANINKKQEKWIDDNCNCDPSEEEEFEEENTDIYPTDPNIIQKEIPGYFYNDGTAPQQLLIPTPNPKKIKLKQSIDWVDYSQNGYQTFYNNNNTTDPNIALKKILNKPNDLVGNQTRTANL
jgi:hypothetical protein